VMGLCLQELNTRLDAEVQPGITGQSPVMRYYLIVLLIIVNLIL